jgi:hypothetical protein
MAAGRRQQIGRGIDQAEAERQFEKLTGHLELSDVNSVLAHYSAPNDVGQDLLTPVWVFAATLLSTKNQSPCG